MTSDTTDLEAHALSDATAVKANKSREKEEMCVFKIVDQKKSARRRFSTD
jgi:hypothetical protein